MKRKKTKKTAAKRNGLAVKVAKLEGLVTTLYGRVETLTAELVQTDQAHAKLVSEHQVTVGRATHLQAALVRLGQAYNGHGHELPGEEGKRLDTYPVPEAERWSSDSLILGHMESYSAATPPLAAPAPVPAPSPFSGVGS